MKTTKSKITKLIQEVTQEILQEHLAQVVPNRQIGEGRKDFDKTKPSKNQTKFSTEVSEKLRSKFVKTGEHVIIGRLCDAVRQMIEHKLYKEGWEKDKRKPQSKAQADRLAKDAEGYAYASGDPGQPIDSPHGLRHRDNY